MHEASGPDDNFDKHVEPASLNQVLEAINDLKSQIEEISTESKLVLARQEVSRSDHQLRLVRWTVIPICFTIVVCVSIWMWPSIAEKSDSWYNSPVLAALVFSAISTGAVSFIALSFKATYSSNQNGPSGKYFKAWSVGAEVVRTSDDRKEDTGNESSGRE